VAEEQQDTAPVIGEYALPSGAVVVFKDPEDLTGDEFKKIMSGIQGDPTEEANLARNGMDLMSGVACVLIESWNVPYLPGLLPPSREPSHLGKLKLKDYKAVLDVAGRAVAVIMPSESGIDEAGVPGSPTEPDSA
jgi:hypothetical protein